MNDVPASRALRAPRDGRSRRPGLVLATALAVAGLLAGGAVVQAQDASPAPDAPAPSGIDGTWVVGVVTPLAGKIAGVVVTATKVTTSRDTGVRT